MNLYLVLLAAHLTRGYILFSACALDLIAVAVPCSSVVDLKIRQ